MIEKLKPSSLIGKKKTEAINLIKFNKLIPRVTVEDGKYQVGSDEIHADRMNIEVKDGIVVAAALG